MSIILASASPRRKELMEMLGIKNLLIIPAEGEEEQVPGRGAEETVLALSLAKAREVAAKHGSDLVIAADTVVCIDGEILGKPKNREDAERMLRRLSGREHLVYTGVTLTKNGESRSAAEMTAVRFRKLSEGEISAYVATGEPMDKAGAYGAQGLASLFVEGISGDFFNVMGLPLCRLGRMLEDFGVVLLSE
ncbi:MAG: Maf family protein [Oscillospiraceae bacterium]